MILRKLCFNKTHFPSSNKLKFWLAKTPTTLAQHRVQIPQRIQYSSEVASKKKIGFNETILKHLETLQEQNKKTQENVAQQLSAEAKMMNKIAEAKNQYDEALAHKKSLQQFIASNANDKELIEIAKEDLAAVEENVEALERKILDYLITEDTDNSKGVIVELRAAAGGDEASLFALELFEMYEKYANLKGWQFSRLSLSASETKGCKEGVAMIQGDGVYGSLKYESGVHRVQRVPVTEAQGRVHTSTATVAILPEAEDVDFTLDPKDLKIETMRAGGAGGQHVNKTESAVRITHIPTGTVVACQDDRSQHANKEKAMKILRSKLYETQKRKLEEERATNRSTQVGQGSRSEKIRTYNFPQDRVTDHRVGFNSHGVDKMLAGELLDDIVEILQQEEKVQQFQAMCEELAAKQSPKPKDDKKKKK